MIGPLSFVIGIGLLSAAALDKTLENARIAGYQNLHNPNVDIGWQGEAAIQKLVRDYYQVYAGFDQKKLEKDFPNIWFRSLIKWTFNEWGLEIYSLKDVRDAHCLEALEALRSGQYLSPYYAQALWLSQCDTKEAAEEVKEEILNSPIIQRAWYDTYEDMKQIELWSRQWSILNVRALSDEPVDLGKYTGRFLCSPRACIIRCMANSFNAMSELKNTYVSPKNESKNSNEPNFGIKPSPGDIYDFIDNIHIDEWDTYGLYKFPNGESCLDDAPNELLATEDQMREFWARNKFLQYEKKEWEICQEFADKYDLSKVGLDVYDIREFCSSYYGPKSTQLMRRDEMEGNYYSGPYKPRDYKYFMREKMGLGDFYAYSKTNIVNLKELREKLQQDRVEMFKSDEEFRRGYYRCVFYESLCTREDKLECLLENQNNEFKSESKIMQSMRADMSTVDEDPFNNSRTEAIRSEFKEAAKEIVSWFDQDWERKKGKPIVLEEKQKRNKPKRLTRNKCSC